MSCEFLWPGRLPVTFVSVAVTVCQGDTRRTVMSQHLSSPVWWHELFSHRIGVDKSDFLCISNAFSTSEMQMFIDYEVHGINKALVKCSVWLWPGMRSLVGRVPSVCHHCRSVANRGTSGHRPGDPHCGLESEEGIERRALGPPDHVRSDHVVSSHVREV